jgi:RHS repeat-associated protein
MYGIYVYGPAKMTIEQINTSTGTVSYLHHDQAGSTRLITGSTGTVTGKCSYSAYGTPTCEGTTTTPLGFDGQYTSSDTGLVYLRHRVYDPATGQFLTVDPLEMYTGEAYGYAGDNPLNYGDPRGLAGESIGEGRCPSEICFPFPNGKETERAIEAAKELGHEIGRTASEVGHGIESVWNEVTSEGESSKEGTQPSRVRNVEKRTPAIKMRSSKSRKKRNETDCHRKTRKCSENGPKSTTYHSVVMRGIPIALSGKNRTTKLAPRITSLRGDRSARRDR